MKKKEENGNKRRRVTWVPVRGINFGVLRICQLQKDKTKGTGQQGHDILDRTDMAGQGAGQLRRDSCGRTAIANQPERHIL
jgi:hypothetical protein